MRYDVGKDLAAALEAALNPTPRAAGAGETIFAEGEPATRIALVRTGLARCASVTCDGRRHVSRFVWPGGFVGIAAGRLRRCAMEAVTPTRLALFSADAVRALTQENAQVAGALTATLARELDQRERAQLRLSRLTAGERIADFLLELCAAQPGGVNFVVPMSRLDIADHLGLTLETVSRGLNRLHRDGVIALDDAHHFRVRCPTRLATEAALEEPPMLLRAG